MKNTALPTNPISLTRLSSILTPKGWYYVCDLAPYRDFGGVLFSDDPVVQADSHAAATGLVWRDSLFIRQPPRWSPQPHFSLGLHWRIANIAPSGDGYIYQTPEGLSIGLRHTRMLSSYTSWEELYIDLHAHIFSFVHSGLLQVYEV
jgi:hypothetical protein